MAVFEFEEFVFDEAQQLLCRATAGLATRAGGDPRGASRRRRRSHCRGQRRRCGSSLRVPGDSAQRSSGSSPSPCARALGRTCVSVSLLRSLDVPARTSPNARRGSCELHRSTAGRVSHRTGVVQRARRRCRARPRSIRRWGGPFAARCTFPIAVRPGDDPSVWPSSAGC